MLRKSIMVTKPQVCLTSKRSRHQRSDGDCALSLGTSVASRKQSGSAYHQSQWTVAATERASASFFGPAQRCQDAQIFQSRRITGHLTAGRDLFEQATHDFATARLG